jgi:hypothetical protein
MGIAGRLGSLACGDPLGELFVEGESLRAAREAQNKKRKGSRTGQNAVFDLPLGFSFSGFSYPFLSSPFFSLRAASPELGVDSLSLQVTAQAAVMLALHIALYVLLGTCLAFAIVELGLSAYVASIWSGDRETYTWNPYEGYVYTTVHVSAPGILIFIVFSACWTILVSAAALVLPWFYTRKGAVTGKLNTILGVSFIVVYFITSVFWLACFADIEAQLGGGTSYSDYLNAVIAFAVLLW